MTMDRLEQGHDGTGTNAAHTAEQASPHWLENGLALAGGHVTITAQHAYALRAVRIDQPLLILPLAGQKRVALGADQTDIGCGRFLMVHQVACVQVENLPSRATGQDYRAWIIPFSWRIVDLARTLLTGYKLSAPDTHGTSPWTAGDAAPLQPALRHLLAALTESATPDAALVDHGLLGVLVALARSGHDRFLRATDPSPGARIRLLVASAPAREWTSTDFESHLHVSGATLRRRLAEENTSLRDLLREARLHHGLALLQTSRKPIKSIAQACGYRSAPSFTRNFIAHFGVEPSAVAIR
jgi:AraC-like DNA-binding protein